MNLIPSPWSCMIGWPIRGLFGLRSSSMGRGKSRGKCGSSPVAHNHPRTLFAQHSSLLRLGASVSTSFSGQERQHAIRFGLAAALLSTSSCPPARAIFPMCQIGPAPGFVERDLRPTSLADETSPTSWGLGEVLAAGRMGRGTGSLLVFWRNLTNSVWERRRRGIVFT